MQSSVAKSMEQRELIHDRTTTDVDRNGALRHERQFTLASDSPRHHYSPFSLANDLNSEAKASVTARSRDRRKPELSKRPSFSHSILRIDIPEHHRPACRVPVSRAVTRPNGTVSVRFVR